MSKVKPTEIAALPPANSSAVLADGPVGRHDRTRGP